jgi:hypothetical protein
MDPFLEQLVIVIFVIWWGRHATLCCTGKLFSMCVKDFVQQKLSSVVIFLVFLTLVLYIYKRSVVSLVTDLHKG